jgi:hypothetical protein
MSPRWIAGLSFVFILATAISLIIEGEYMGSDELNVINELTGFQAMEAGGILSIPLMAVGFITHGLPKVLMWDYAFFSGGLEIIRWVLMPLSITVVWGLIQTFISVAQGLLARFV